jgi:hypothetical protein
MDQVETSGVLTRAEILQQPALWWTTVARAREFDPDKFDSGGSVVISGADTSSHEATTASSLE